MRKKDYIVIVTMILGVALVGWSFTLDKESGLLVSIVGWVMIFGLLGFNLFKLNKEIAEEAKKKKEAYEKERVEFVNSFNSKYNGVNELTREQIAEDPQYYYNLMCKIVEDMMRYKDSYEYLDLDFEKVDSLQKQIEELWIRKFETQLVGKDEFYAFLKKHDWYLSKKRKR